MIFTVETIFCWLLTKMYMKTPNTDNADAITASPATYVVLLALNFSPLLGQFTDSPIATEILRERGNEPQGYSR
jgi:hypothetical protein